MNKRCVFIPTYGRAKTFSTLNTLIKAGYTGDYRLVVSTDDEQYEEYEKLYGDKVIVFDKNDYAWVDTMDLRGTQKVVLFARIAIQEMADKIGVEEYCVFDDDLQDLNYRFIQDGKLRSKKVLNADGVIEAIFSFMNETDASAVSFSLPFELISGIESYFPKRQCFSFFFHRADKKISFRGRIGEDMITLLDEARTGGLFFSIPQVMATAPEQASNEGGMAYKTDLFKRNFYVVMAHPSEVELRQDGRLIRHKEYMFPKILNERNRNA